ncbi:GTPase HflX, partial [Alcaligenes pakistanensis]
MKALVISVDMGELDYKAHAEEFVMLAEGAGAQIVELMVVRRSRPDAAYYIGTGKLDEAV